MSLKQDIETWVAALGHYDNNEFDEALRQFDGIADTSKILFNCGVIHATLGEHEKAVECYQRAVRLDQYLAVAYFQQGVSNFLVGDFEEALANFNDTLLYLRGNNMIDYAQLGLLFKLYSCEVLFNRGLCYIYLQQKVAGMQDFSFAVKEKVVEDHNVIDEAIKEEAEGYTVFSIPVGVVYRPNQAKVKNLQTKDYLGKARLVATSDRSNAFAGYGGSEAKKAGRLENIKDDRSAEIPSFLATNLVKPGLSSKRQQSEPPINRNVFPPTPPPEFEKAPSLLCRGQSVRNGSKPTPPKLNLDRSRSNQRYEVRDEIYSQSPREETYPQPPRPQPPRDETYSQPSCERIGTQRTASEPRGLARQHPERSRPQIEDPNDYANDVYDMYSSRNSRNRRSNGYQRQQQHIEEEESDYDKNTYVDGEFEIMNNRPAPLRTRTASVSRQRKSQKPELRMVRLKIHAVHAEERRYMMINTTIGYLDLVEKIKDKFGIMKRIKLTVQDDGVPGGDMITLGDQDDLDSAMISVKANATREKLDMGKMEVWVEEIKAPIAPTHQTEAS